MTFALNAEQQSVVDAPAMPVLVAAIAGAGKTRALVERIVKLIEDGADPARILAVTFSVKAAREMMERLHHRGCTDARVGTFHSLALQIVRQEYPEQRGWEIDDKDRFRICVKEAVSYRYMDWKQADVTHLLSFIARCKANGFRPDMPDTLLLAKQFYQKRPTAGREPNLCKEAYITAELIRRERCLRTFDDMLIDAVDALSNEDTRVRWASNWDHVLQDEAQDENWVQHQLGSYLAQYHRSYTVVGDPAQCHPAGTLIDVGQGQTVPIETLRTGDAVRGWNQNAQKMIGGRRVSVATRDFSGRLLRVSVAGREVTVTPDHKFVARWTTRETDVCVTYLMYRKGFGYRVGWCKLFSRDGAGSISLHLAMRARLEKADRTWILQVHETRTGASVYESIVAARFGIPTATFEPVDAVHQTAESIRAIFDGVNTSDRGITCLEDHGLHFDTPLYPWPDREAGTPQGRRTLFQVHASNLLPGLMSVPLPDGIGTWAAVETKSQSDWQSTTVFSLDVAVDETYAANGIVVHNSIFQFRGADPSGLLSFEKEWGAHVVRMGTNYRCARTIVDLANRTLAAMPTHTHLGVMMQPIRSELGTVRAVEYMNFDLEGEGVTEAILESHEDGHDWKSHVVLYRTNAQSRGVEEAMLSARIPYVVLGGTNFYDRREVKDLLAYMRIAEGRGTADDVRRSINTPFRFLGKAFVEGLSELSFDKGIVSAVRSYVLNTSGLQQRQRTSAIGWCQLVESITRVIEAGMSAQSSTRDTPAEIEAFPSKILEHLVSDLRYNEWLTRDEGAESPENNRVSNVRELVRAAGRFPTVAELLDYVDDTVARAKRAKKDFTGSDVVTLCSIHRSKGLEWPAVFVIGCNDKILPHAHADDSDEERRLFYVACTRAADRLELSYVSQAAVSNRVAALKPSQYLIESGVLSTQQCPEAC